MSNINKKRDYYGAIRVAAAILLAFAIAGLIICLVADNPMEAITKFIIGPFQSKRNFFNILEKMIPLVFTGLAINIMHKSGLFSMSADSSLYMGAVVATYIAVKFSLPNVVHQFTLIVAAGILGGLISIIPALIRKKTGASELVTSLMMNYVFFHFGLWIVMTFLIDEQIGAQSEKFAPTAMLGNILKGTRLHYGFFIMIAIIIFMYILIEKSKFGNDLLISGSNVNFAKYTGISITSTVMGSQFIGGALAGMGGAIEMVGMNTRFTWVTSVAYVWDGILINLLANSKPILIPLAAFFLSYVRVGADIMSRSTNVSNEIVAIIQAIIILLIASERFLYKMKKKKEEREALANENAKHEDEATVVC